MNSNVVMEHGRYAFAVPPLKLNVDRWIAGSLDQTKALLLLSSLLRMKSFSE